MSDVLRLERLDTGEVLNLRRVREVDGQVVLHIEGTLPPNKSGPPLHIHHLEREEGVVKKGTLGAQVGKEKITVPAGGQGVFEAGVPHSWWNAGDGLLELNGKVVPAVDLDRYLQAIFAVLNSSKTGRPSLFYLAHVAWRHRHTQSLMLPPPAVQKVVFPIVLFLGGILGKYRGDDWPGSPASCPGAPEPTA